MKRILFFVLVGFATIQFANAQLVELIGKGVYNVNPSELIISDPGSVEKVVVVATARFDDSAIPANVTFSDDDDSFNVGFNNADPILAPTYVVGGPIKFGYYTATFTDVDGKITLNNFGQEEYVRSFTAYVYRTANSEVYSEVQGEYAFVYLNSSNDPLVYNFNIPTSNSARDITVSLPFTDLESGDLRYANVAVTAGSQKVMREFDTNNEGDLLHIETLTLSDVPGDVTDVMVEIYSPNQAVDQKNGDSFVTGPAVLTTTVEVEEDWGCTYTQGYWKTHSEHGPAPYDDNWLNLSNIGADTEFYLSEMTWYEVFWTPVKGNAYYNLAHQYMAAHLNMLMGTSVPTEVADALADAEGIFAAKEPGYYAKTKGKSEASKQEIAWLTSLASILASYNEGDIGPGHCDDMEEWDMEKSAQIESINNDIVQSSELTVYPNPVSGYATISFKPVYDGKTTVDLYNSTGQTVKRLFSESVTKDIPVNFTFTAAEFSEGLYFLVVQNGQGRESAKVNIK